MAIRKVILPGGKVDTTAGWGVPQRKRAVPDWVAADDDRYMEIALRPTPERLREIRHELPDLIDRRCSPATYTRTVEAAYRTMWQKCCAERL